MKTFTSTLPARPSRFLPVVLLTLTIFLNAFAAPGSVTHATGALGRIAPGSHDLGLLATTDTPPSDADCLAQKGLHCYSPQQIRVAYGLSAQPRPDLNGAGQTIVIVDAFGSPTIREDLHTFDQGHGLSDPPSFQIYAPLGSLPFDVNNPEMVGWAGETTLDVEWAHTIAPAANIVLLTSPVAETQGVQGMPEFLALEKYALDHRLGKIISQSWATTENNLFQDQGGYQVFRDFEQFYRRARQEHVTVLSASGDFGNLGPDLSGANLYNRSVVGYPASSPQVTSVGGTILSASPTGQYQSETVWSDDFGAGGGGLSQYFKEPDYQKADLPTSLQPQVGDYRAIPDVAYNASFASGISTYTSFPGIRVGWHIFGGTSAGAPQWAGLVALANQQAGYLLGFLNPNLYRLGHSPRYSQLFHDLTTGSNTFDPAVPGYTAGPGWDLASGWGSPKANSLLAALNELVNPTDFNLFVTGNLDLTGGGSQVQGRIGAGGNVNLASLALHQDVVTNGNLNWNGGTLDGGNAVYSRNINLQGVSINGGRATRSSVPFSTRQAQVLMEEISADWAALSPNGNVSFRYGNLTLIGNQPDQNVFRLKASDLATAHSLQITVPSGATAILNIEGTTGQIGNLGISLTGLDRQHLVFNFYQARNIGVSGVSFEGLLWSPKAAVNFTNAALHGSIVAASLSGSGNFEYYQFLGSLPA